MSSREPGRAGAYRLVRHWASGDTSQVFLARRDDSATLVALKTLRAEHAHDRSHAERFRREAELAVRVRHEHVVESLESFEHEGSQYLAMEFLHGETLHDVLRAIHPHRRMPAALALEITHRLARGLDHLHRAGAIHGDVCPANIILTYDGRVKLIDLGGRCDGTSAHVAPELARGEPIDPRADLFSLGLILFEMLTGHRVRHGWGEREVVASAISGAIPRLSDLVETDPDLDALVMTAVAYDRRARLPDVAAFADALLQYRERVVPGLMLSSKLCDFMERQFAGRARALQTYLAGDRPALAHDRLVGKVPPLGQADPAALIEAALRTSSPSPFIEPVTADMSWTNERTASGELAPLPARSRAPIVIGLILILIAAMVGSFLLGGSFSS